MMLCSHFDAFPSKCDQNTSFVLVLFISMAREKEQFKKLFFNDGTTLDSNSMKYIWIFILGNNCFSHSIP